MNKPVSLYWIGVRESEIEGTGSLFKGSITVYGSSTGNNHSFDKAYGYRFDCNIDHEEWIAFVNGTAECIADKDSDSRFMLYYPADFSFYSHVVKEKVVYINDCSIISLLENKIRTRLWLSDYVKLPPFYVMEGRNISLKLLTSRFPGASEFVVQSEASCSGSGTWLFTKKNEFEIISRINAANSYSVSPYFRNSVPVNIHIVIYQDMIVYLPPSVQIISSSSDSLSYKGADFIAYKQLSPDIHKKVVEYAAIIGKLLSSARYRGVCGVDFIATADEVYFMEVNSRFQGSTTLINCALEDIGAGLSLQQLHIDAFTNKKCSFIIPEFDVNYSFCSYSYQKDGLAALTCLYNAQKDCADFVTCLDDNLDWRMELQENSYLFELLFRRNIVAVTPDNCCTTEANIDLSAGLIDAGNWASRLLALKIMLFNHGVRPGAAMRGSRDVELLNFKEFKAVDMVLQNLYFSVPYGTQMSRLSPFEIDKSNDGGYVLNYLGETLSEVELRAVDPIGARKLENGFGYDEIAYLGNDRLRVYHRNSCFYKTSEAGCGFCDVENNNRKLTIDDIKKVIDSYSGHPSIRHYLIGGGSDALDSDFSKIISIAKHIKDKTNMPIFLMSTPPFELEILLGLYQAGITEVSFNLEVFDRRLAEKYMPGKGAIPLYVYENAFKEAVKLWGKDGRVRTTFIVGLEEKESLLRGIEFSCELGVSPTLSLFKPIAGTPLAHMLPPSDQDILSICLEAEALCGKYGLKLGPACKYCEDNTLKISLQ